MKQLLVITVAFGLLGSVQYAGANGGDPGKNRIDVMTQNQYLGADLSAIVSARDGEAFNAAVVQVLEDIAANDLPSRADALARLIANRLPELVGLQEVFVAECTDLAPSTPDDEGCDNPRIRNAFNDHLSRTLAALAERGEIYYEVATVVNINTSGLSFPPVPISGVPFTIDEFDAVVNFRDRDVILAREDIAVDATPVDFTSFDPSGIFCLMPSADGCNYQAVASATLWDGTKFDIKRGFVGVDVTVDGKDYRFITTHLEGQTPVDNDPFSAIIQAAQAQELIGTLELTTPPGRSLLVVGDINSSPDDKPINVPEPQPPGFPPVIVPPYMQFTTVPPLGPGYTDTWDLRQGNRIGYSCCQDKDLWNHRSVLDERVDVIFSLEEPDRVQRARVLGARVGDKTRTPGNRLWPSDHGSVAAELRFK